jgi:hypothetical protein
VLKLVTFAGYDNRYGPHIFPIEPDVEKTIGHIKMARPLPTQIEGYIREAKPIPGKAQLLIDAMGAGEYFGSNVNGDYFPEVALSHKGADYGYETFMHYAYPYRHHVNKDPARAYGERVTLSAYDPHMHRVLLIVRVDDRKCFDILSDLADGRYADVSMGCKVPWDECSICKNRARNRGEYCPHLRYQMNKILQDGRRVCAYNWLPKFFDISFVTIGAEKASHVLKKVAHTGAIELRSSAELGELHYSKLAAARKQADIDKDVPSRPPAVIQGVTPEDKEKLRRLVAASQRAKALEPELPTNVLDSMAGFPLQQVFSTIAALGMDLRPAEFQRIVLIKEGARPLADKLAQHRLVFDESRPASAMPKWAGSFGQFDVEAVNEKLAMMLRPYVPGRSLYPEILLTRLEKFAELPAYYRRDNQWYPMTEEQQRQSSGIPGLVPASAALAAGFLVFRKAFPELVMKGPGPIKALARHPWMLPLLLGAGIGASVGLSHATVKRPLSDYGTGDGLDAKKAGAYHGEKTASIGTLGRVGLIPLMYMYAGVQQKRMQRGEDLNALDRLIAMRPGMAALSTFAAAPAVSRGAARLFKHSSSQLVGPAFDPPLMDALERLPT